MLIDESLDDAEVSIQDAERALDEENLTEANSKYNLAASWLGGIVPELDTSPRRVRTRYSCLLTRLVKVREALKASVLV